MALVTVAELRETLGIGSALYDDATVQSCIDAAELIVLSILQSNTYAVAYAELTDNVARLWTVEPHGFVIGQTVHNDLGEPFNGSNVLTAVTEYSMSWAKTHADVKKYQVMPRAWVGIEPDYSTTPPVCQAALMISADIWQARTATNGQPAGLDFTPAPYTMGRSMLSRVQGLIGKYIDVKTLVG